MLQGRPLFSSGKIGFLFRERLTGLLRVLRIGHFVVYLKLEPPGFVKRHFYALVDCHLGPFERKGAESDLSCESIGFYHKSLFARNLAHKPKFSYASAAVAHCSGKHHILGSSRSNKPRQKFEFPPVPGHDAEGRFGAIRIWRSPRRLKSQASASSRLDQRS